MIPVFDGHCDTLLMLEFMKLEQLLEEQPQNFNLKSLKLLPLDMLFLLV